MTRIPSLYSALLVVISMLIVSSQASAEAYEWELRKDHQGIQVFTKKVASSPYKAVKAEAIVEDTRLSSLAALIMDAEACPKWADKCAESYVYKQLSDTEFYVYSNNDMPFPVKDRDALSHVRWWQNPDSLEVVMEGVATTDIMERIKGRLRLTEAKTTWRFTPLGEGKVQVINESHINPGSKVPGWLTNMLLVDTPYETMKDFLSEVKADKYKQARVAFISEEPVSQ